MEVKEEIILLLAVKRGWLSSSHLDEMRREKKGGPVNATAAKDEWHIISRLVQAGELTLEQLESLTKEAVDSRSDSPPAGAMENGKSGKSESPPGGGDRFRIERYLGSGGMGEVYKAFDTKLLRHIALKRLKADVPELHPRLLREAQLQARIEHENICRIYDIGENQGRWFIAMQYIEGKSLKQLAGEITLEEKVNLLQSVAEALHAAHRLGLIHRDVKPANIMVETGSDGRLKPYITDFGLVRDVNRAGPTVTEGLLGSPHYMSPEQAGADMKKIDRRTDVYGLGVTLYELLTGELPFQGTVASVMVQVLQREAKPVRRLNPAVPLDLETIVMKCLEKDPNRRYGSTRELAEDLGRFLNGEPILARRYTFAQRWAKAIRRHRTLAIVSTVAAAAVLVLLGLWLRAQWRTRTAAEVASRFGQDVQEMNSIMRFAYLVPPHDIRPDRERVKAKISEIEKKMKDLGAVAQGPGNYALGQGYLALRDYAQARKYLETAWQKGFRTPEAAYALGATLGELYREELAKAERIPDRNLGNEVKKQLEIDYVKPALEKLNATKNVRSIPTGYPEALMAFYDNKYEKAMKTIENLKGIPERFYEVKILKGDILRTIGDNLWNSGKAADAYKNYRQAEEAYKLAAETGRSDPRHLIFFAELFQRMGYCQMYVKDANVQDILEKGILFCNQAIELDPENVQAYIAKSNIYSILGLYFFNNEQKLIPFLNNAMDSAKKAITLDPRNDQGLYIAGKILQTKGAYLADSGKDPLVEFREAVELFNRSLAINPNNLSTQIEMARTLFVYAKYQFLHGIKNEDNLKQAVNWGISLVKQFPNNAMTQTLLGSALYYKFLIEFHEGKQDWADIERAISAYQKAISLIPQRINNYMICGIMQILKSQAEMDSGKDPRNSLNEALILEKKALHINPKFTDACLFFGHAHIEMAQYQLFHGIDPTSELNQGELFLKKAIDLGSKTYEIYKPLLLAEYINAQRAYWLNHSPGRFIIAARKKFAMGFAINSRYFDLYNDYARILLIHAKYNIEHELAPDRILTEAQNIIQKAISIKPDDYISHRLMGDLYLLKASWKIREKRNPEEFFNESEKEISISQKLNPFSTYTFLLKAKWFLKKIKWERIQKRQCQLLIDSALKHVDEAIKTNDDIAESYIVKGFLFQERAVDCLKTTMKDIILLMANQSFNIGYSKNSFLKMLKADSI